MPQPLVASYRLNQLVDWPVGSGP